MDGIRIAISGPKGAGKRSLAEAIAFHSQIYTHRKITIDGARYLLADDEPDLGVSITANQIEIVTVDCEDFVDTAVGRVEGARFRDADPEVAYHVRRLLSVGFLPAGVACRILSRSARTRTGL